MFLLDDILLAPMKGLAAICQKVREAAQEDLEKQEKEILAALAELHQLLDVGQIGEEDFNRRESGLLDRLDACQEAGSRTKEIEVRS
jgi:ribosomal protein L29